jgi:hypothetical protein
MPKQGKPGGRRESAGLSQLPQQQRQRRPGKTAPAPRARSREEAPAGPGGLGYVLGLDDDEKAGIKWHGTSDAKALPRRK